MLPTSLQQAQPEIDRKHVKDIRDNGVIVLVVGISLIAVDGAAVNLVNTNEATGSTYTTTYSGVWGGAVCVAASAYALSMTSSSSAPKRNVILASSFLSSIATLQMIAVMALQGLAASSCIAQPCTEAGDRGGASGIESAMTTRAIAPNLPPPPYPGNIVQPAPTYNPPNQ